ncbi:MAG: hypothetical protein FD143_803 [Ignavibacteria bacterium]|nr:MAG: hypothetical protein FD143_803 [Ignavibacteria bacterium]KAF0160611.1 MAG: hypothetical protein FD188_1603 [Ignavibacteria bacterium]
MIGEKIADIFNGELVQGANNFPIVSNKLNSGIYLVAIKANNKVNRIKIVLIK